MGKRRVEFNCDKNKIYYIIAWSFAYKQARKSNYEQLALDRYRFQDRVNKTGKTLNKILEPNYRNKIFEERFANFKGTQ